MTSLTPDSYGYPMTTTISRVSPNPATLMTLGYTFNASRGFPTARSNSAFGWNETFGFDNLDRLTIFNDNDGNHSQAYDGRGRISSNTRLGSYNYSGTSYQQSGLDLNTTADLYYQGRTEQSISYTAFKSPVEIHEPGHERYGFQYNVNLDRANMFYGSFAPDQLLRPLRRHYSADGGVEISKDLTNGKTSFVFYLGGDAYSAPAIWKETYSASPTTQQLFYLHRDYLGSIVLITNTDGQTVEKRQFDAWGRMVRLQDGANNNLSNFTVVDRGFTGHEHLLPVGLIHMNARLYDPLLGRFLAPDNYIQDPYGTQNFNRYGYALNNPLVYVDPDGELLWLIPVAFFLFFTDAGYELQKYVSPVAFHVDWGLGSHERKLGFNVSWGVPKISPYSYREDYGATYYWKHISGDYTGWENRKGYEHSLLGLYHWE